MAENSKRGQHNSVNGEWGMLASRRITKPSKQRKMLYQAPDHIRYRLFAAPLSPELRASHLVKTMPVRNGDTVRIMRGDHKRIEGKVTRIDRRKYRLYVEGLTREKVDGTAIFVPVHPSKVMITALNLDDKWRRRILERKKEIKKEIGKVTGEPKRDAIETKEKIAEPKEVRPEEPKRKKPKRRRKKVAEKPATTRTPKEEVETKPEEAPKAKKRRTRRKTGGAEGGQ